MTDTQTVRRGRKAVENKDAPHGYTDGKPNAPYGYLANGKPRVSAPAPEVDALSADMLAAPEEVPADLVSRTAPARARDEKQQAIDNVVKALHEAWVAAGSPAAWEKMPKKSYTVPASQVEGVKRSISRAADFHQVAAKFGTPLPVVREVRNPKYGQENQPETIKARLVMIPFAAKDKRERKTPAGDGQQK